MAEQNMGFRRVMPTRQHIVEQTIRALPCPFINLVDIEVWQRGKGNRLSKALQASAQAKAIVIELDAITSLKTLRNAVGKVLRELGTNAHQISEKDQWWFIAGEKNNTSIWFCTVHAKIYPTNHSRHWPMERPVITLVPAWIFKRVLPGGADPSTRRDVRNAFEKQGMHYAIDPGAIAGTKI